MMRGIRAEGVPLRPLSAGGRAVCLLLCYREASGWGRHSLAVSDKLCFCRINYLLV